MGNLRRLLVFLALLVFFWPIGNPDTPFLPGLAGAKNYLFILLLTWGGVLVGLTGMGWRRGDSVMDGLVLSILAYATFATLYSFTLDKRTFSIHPILFLYTTYFLGRLVDVEDFERYLPYTFALGMFFVFLTTIYEVLLFAGEQFRFGTRTAFFSPVGIVFSTYMFNRERSPIGKGVFLLTVILSTVVLILFGNRTAYLATFLLFGALLWVSKMGGNLRSMLLTIGGMGAVGSLSVLALGSLYVGPLFIIYVINRFLSIFTRLGKGQDASVLIRKYDIAAALERWAQEPFFGRSPSDYMLRGLDGSILVLVDNAYVTLLWKYGAMGLMLILLFLTYSAYAVLAIVRREITPFSLLLLLLFADLLIISISTSVYAAYVHVASLSLLLGVASTKLAGFLPYNTGNKD